MLEFGRYGNALEAYILVANYLTRRIHSAVRAEESKRRWAIEAMEPPQLLITIEEAHKFLDPLIARQTIFGTIARELRKYNVTLLIVDQRPSGIDEEVMSQIGTRVTALLDNERDIAAVLTGDQRRGRSARSSGAAGHQAAGHHPGARRPDAGRGQDAHYDTEFYKSLTGESGDAPRSAKGNDRESRRIR